MPDPAVLLRSAALDGTVTDVLVDAGTVAAIGPDLPVPRGAQVVDLDGRVLLPGLWDAHVHFDQWTLARRRLDLGPARSAAEVVALVAARLRTDPPEPGTVLVGHGFRDALWPDAPHRDLLDPVTGAVPVVLVAADLHCCWLNSAAAARYGMADHPTGLVRERDWMPIMIDVRSARRARPLVRRRAAGPRPRGAWSGSSTSRRRGSSTPGPPGSPGAPTRCGWWRRCGRRRWTARRADRPRSAHRRRRSTGTGGLLTGAAQGRHRRLAQHPYGLLRRPVPRADRAAGPRRAARWRRRAAAAPAARRPARDRRGDARDRRPRERARARRLRRLDDPCRAARRVGASSTLSSCARDPRGSPRSGCVASVQPEHALDDRDVDRPLLGGPHGPRLRPTARARRRRRDRSRLRRARGAARPVGHDRGRGAPQRATGGTSWHPEQAIPSRSRSRASTAARGPMRWAARRPGVTDVDPTAMTAPTLRAMPVAGTLLGGRWTHRVGI